MVAPHHRHENNIHSVKVRPNAHGRVHWSAAIKDKSGVGEQGEGSRVAVGN
jgi:hypothetical protein